MLAGLGTIAGYAHGVAQSGCDMKGGKPCKQFMTSKAAEDGARPGVGFRPLNARYAQPGYATPSVIRAVAPAYIGQAVMNDCVSATWTFLASKAASNQCPKVA